MTFQRYGAIRLHHPNQSFNSKEVLTAKVSQVLDGGLSVVVEEVRIFIPASLVSDVYERDLSKYASTDSHLQI